MNAKVIIGILLVALFIYLLITNPSFTKYAENSIETMNTSFSPQAFENFFNATKNMTKGQFINWSESNKNNPVISKVLSTAGNVTDNLGKLWNSVNGLKGSLSWAANKTETIYQTLNKSIAGITANKTS